MPYINQFPIPTIDVRESSVAVRTALGLGSPFDLFDPQKVGLSLPEVGIARWITTESNTNPAAVHPAQVRTTTGYAKALQFDGSWSAVLGTGNPATTIQVEIPFAGANTVAPRILHVVSCDAAGDYDGDITLLNASIAVVALDVSRCPSLLHLTCSNVGAGLTDLDLSNNPNLVTLELTYNKLRYLNLAGKEDLEELRIYGNLIDRLILTDCSSLTYLDATTNQLTELEVTDCTALGFLNLASNNLTQLDLSGLAALSALLVSNNQLASINLTGCAALEYVDLSNNDLLHLDVSAAQSSLIQLYAANNHLESLDLADCVNLETFDVSNNELTSLTITGSTQLGYDYYTDVDVSDNQLDAAALDALYTDLALSAAVAGNVYVTNNPGTTDDDPSICAANWTVIGS